MSEMYLEQGIPHKRGVLHTTSISLQGNSMIVHRGSVPYRLGFSSYVYHRFFILILVKPQFFFKHEIAYAYVF